MRYKDYLRGIPKSIKIMELAKYNGVKLSENEEFDLMFKKELQRIELGVCKDGFVALHIKYMCNYNMVLAKYYATCFSMLIKQSKKGYTTEDLIKCFKKIFKGSLKDGICSGDYGIKLEDKNSKMKVSVTNELEEVIDSAYVTNVESMVQVGLTLIQLFGSVDEYDESFSVFLESYLSKEYKKLEEGLGSIPFIDDKFSVKSLADYVSTAKKVSTKVERSCNIITMKASNQ